MPIKHSGVEMSGRKLTSESGVCGRNLGWDRHTTAEGWYLKQGNGMRSVVSEVPGASQHSDVREMQMIQPKRQ